jgi:hypothetical protein
MKAVIVALEEALRSEVHEEVATAPAPVAVPLSTMTWNQFREVFTLASAFGHEWTFGMPFVASHEKEALMMAFYKETNNGDPIAIASLSRTRREGNWAPGIETPVLVDGNVVHKTGTGRVEWTVDRNGVVTVLVTRPNGPVLRLGEGAERHLYAERVGKEEVGMRHLAAAYRVFAALNRGEEAFIALHCIPAERDEY